VSDVVAWNGLERIEEDWSGIERIRVALRGLGRIGKESEGCSGGAKWIGED